MAKKLLAVPLALAVVLGAQTVTFAQQTTDDQTTGNPQTAPNDQAQPNAQAPTQGMTRAEAAIKTGAGMQIADLPAGSWATNATQVAVANGILPLQDGRFNGDQNVTADDLHHAMDVLTNTAENINGKGALPDLRSVVASLPTGDQPVSRLQVAQALSSFLNTASAKNVVAMAAPRNVASRFTDLGTMVPPSVQAAVDRYKVMTGFPDGSFRPQDNVTRYQMAAIALHVLNDMAQAPVAQLPVQPTPPNIIVVPPQQAPVAAVPPAPTGRPNFRQNTPINVSWQALNGTDLSPGNGYNVVPVSAMFTGYWGPVMLQNVTDLRVNVYNSNIGNTEFRLGYANWKWSGLQFIPYVGFNLGGMYSVPGPQTQYDTYAGATYGGILSWMPTSNVDIFGTLGQAALLGAGRYNQNFQTLAVPTALGTFLSNYSLGVDFYVSPNIALTLAAGTWQSPNNFNSTSNLSQFGVTNTYGGSAGIGFGF
ncbi:MAG TPA: S-layer homology domain-containing protein [Oscillatoriaceae cyanobacterium]